MDKLSSINNQPSFGMAFKRPGNEVMQCFRKVLHNMKPAEQDSFVKEMSDIVKGNESCPVKIEQYLTNNYERKFATSVGYNSYYVSPSNSGKEILNTMRTAAEEARRLENAEKNMNKISELYVNAPLN